MELKDKNLYYVGGYVRDKILGKKSIDIDYCYQGNAIDFANNMGLQIIQTNPDFGTVRVMLDGKQIDIASTRKEIYPRKGHLPIVTDIGCSLREDTARRDFTINSMAIRTTDNEFFDYWGGMVDLNKKLIRVLHKDSFSDDPTRIVRGLKFSVRFNFKLADVTKTYQDEYLSNINYDMSYYRLKKELVEAFSPNLQKTYTLFIKQGIYKLLGENQQKPEINISVSKLLKNYPCQMHWLVYLSLFDLSNLPLTRKERKILEWAELLKTEKPTAKTPFESILIYKLKNDENNV